MSDSLTGFDQMRAIIESLRREVREQRKEIARLQAEINRLRLTDAEREAIMGVANFVCELPASDETKVTLRKTAATLRGLLERTDAR